MPAPNPARKAAPNADISVDFGRSTGICVKSQRSWVMKSFLETPPSILKKNFFVMTIKKIMTNGANCKDNYLMIVKSFPISFFTTSNNWSILKAILSKIARTK